MEKTGGFCFPEFVIRGVRLWFALDNIDFCEDTPFDQNTTHGTVVVVWQEDVPHGEKVNPPLEVPAKAKETDCSVEYLALSDIVPKAIRFENVQVNDQSKSDEFLSSYYINNQAWALICHLTDHLTEEDNPDAAVTSDDAPIADEPSTGDREENTW